MRSLDKKTVRETIEPEASSQEFLEKKSVIEKILALRVTQTKRAEIAMIVASHDAASKKESMEKAIETFDHYRVETSLRRTAIMRSSLGRYLMKQDLRQVQENIAEIDNALQRESALVENLRKEHQKSIIVESKKRHEFIESTRAQRKSELILTRFIAEARDGIYAG